MSDRYCGTCGEEYGVTILVEHFHECADSDTEPAFCSICGAELTDTGSCDNDHEDDITGWMEG